MKKHKLNLFYKQKLIKLPKKVYNFIIIPSKQNVFFCLTKKNGDLLKNWTLTSFKIKRHQWKSKGQIKRITLLIRKYLKSLNAQIIFKSYTTNYRYLKIAKDFSKKLYINRIILNCNTPFNGCRLPKHARK